MSSSQGGVNLPTVTRLDFNGTYAGEDFQSRYRRFKQRVDQIDLSLVSLKVAHPNIGYGWSEEFTQRLAAEYRKYFALHAAFPDVWLPPSQVLDYFWHEHILDTRAYFADCDFVAGHYIHHYPYFGMRSPADVDLVLEAFACERDLYQVCIGHAPPRDLWSVDVTKQQLMTLIDGRYANPAAAAAAALMCGDPT